MTRNGKIARLPLAIREELNRRLENGETGVGLIEWLNGLPEVKEVLAADFGGVPITDMNLSYWKNGGFLDWQAQQKAESMMERWHVERPKSNGGSTAGNQSPTSGAEGRGSGVEGSDPSSSDFDATGARLRQGYDAASGVAQALASRLMVHYAAALEDALAESDEKPRKRVDRLGQSLREVVRVRRYDLAREHEQERSEIERERLKMEREWLALSQQRTAEGMRKKFEEWATESGLRAQNMTDEEREEAIRIIYGREKREEAKASQAPAETTTGIDAKEEKSDEN